MNTRKLIFLTGIVFASFILFSQIIAQNDEKFTQADLVAALIRALGLEDRLGSEATLKDKAAYLKSLDYAPLGGWDLEKTLYKGDAAAVLGQILKVKVWDDAYVYVASGGQQDAGAIPYKLGRTASSALMRAGVLADKPQPLELSIIHRQHTGGEWLMATQLAFEPAHPDKGLVPLLPEDALLLPKGSSKVVYVTGGVKKPGALPHRKELTALQAILDSDGVTQDAVRTKVEVLRKGTNGWKQIPVDMDAIQKKEKRAQNVTLVAGDIVLVPVKQGITADDYIEQLASLGIMTPGEANSPFSLDDLAAAINTAAGLPGVVQGLLEPYHAEMSPPK